MQVAEWLFPRARRKVLALLLRDRTRRQHLREIVRRTGCGIGSVRRELADRDLKDCRSPGLSADWRFNIACNAILRSASAALATAGFRAGRQAHHYRVLQSLALTAGLDESALRQLDAFRKKRNLTEYERASAVRRQVEA